MMRMQIRPGLDVDESAIARFCRSHAITRMALYGSVTRTDFDDDSDVDVLVEFKAGQVPGLLRMAAMELELGTIVGREVELRTYEDLSRYFRDEVRESARLLYAA